MRAIPKHGFALSKEGDLDVINHNFKQKSIIFPI